MFFDVIGPRGVHYLVKAKDWLEAYRRLYPLFEVTEERWDQGEYYRYFPGHIFQTARKPGLDWLERHAQ